MTEMFLLGAGASVEAGIPDAYGMTRVMLESVAADDENRYRRLDKVLQFVVGGLLFQQGVRGENPYDGVNIEDLFNAIILLGERHHSDLGPFISSWHPQLMGFESGRLTTSASRGLLEAIFEPVQDYVRQIGGRWRPARIDTFSSSHVFEPRFADAVRQVVIGGEGRLFKAAADAMILKLVGMVWITDPARVAYLTPLVRHANVSNSTVVTLNYDNSIELAGQVTGVAVDTGFDSWSDTGEFGFEEGKVPLLKLHGSIDWALSDGVITEARPLPFQVIKKVSPNADEPQGLHPAVVFGGKNKLTAKGPFLGLLRAFDRALSSASSLWAIGYSFRDEHVNEFITKWFNGEPTRQVIIVNPRRDTIDKGLARDLLEGHGQTRVRVVESTAAMGISELGARG